MAHPIKTWSRQAGNGALALFPEEHISVLDNAGLADLVQHPESVRDLDLEFTRVGWGGKSKVYEVNGTEVLVKKYFPYFWREGEFKDRKVTAKAVLGNLAVNVAFEHALRRSRDYITPLYLGHLVLQADQSGKPRHYTLMTRLPIESSQKHSRQELEHFFALYGAFKQRSALALLLSGGNPFMVRWKEADPFVNVVPLAGKHKGRVGVIDMESRRARYPRTFKNIPSAYWEDEDPWIGNL